jgi:hypothetical protein
MNNAVFPVQSVPPPSKKRKPWRVAISHLFPYTKRSPCFQLVLARKMSFYVVTYYLPSGLFVVVSWISFLVNPEVRILPTSHAFLHACPAFLSVCPSCCIHVLPVCMYVYFLSFRFACLFFLSVFLSFLSASLFFI